ncbi:MAG: UDP-N-acetylmuramoyl-L-alanine--D-glutamate ligase [Ignavibacteriales bacterium]|nr:UDP-N-acetylmuramoyl-L-alanine--D-glutamate ligase [Ignavibacteriales bacterium]
MNVSQLRNTKISVIGAARSGIAVATLLQKSGATVFVSDRDSAEKLKSQIPLLTSGGIAFELGGHTERVYDCSLMVLSPGVPSNTPVVLEAQKRGIKVVSEVEVASWFCRSPIVAITGSNGKTTTTTLIGRMLGDAKKKHAVAGNIGTAFSAVVLELAETDIAVLEISSFQLDHCETFRPKISVVLNITQNHMDRYDNSMEQYASSKARIFMNQANDDSLIYDADDMWTQSMIGKARCRRIPFSIMKRLTEGAFIENGTLVTILDGKRTEIISTDQVSIAGPHNLYNAMASTLTAQLMGVGSASLRATLKNFKGVEHRQEFIRELNGVKYVNDSKATSVDAVWYALQAFKEPMVLMLGGRDKGNDYSRLHALVKNNVRAIVAIGESAEKVEKAFTGIVPVQRANAMDDAVLTAQRLAKPGDVVLLSPACASFDWFENYEQRGMVFKELVRNLS